MRTCQIIAIDHPVSYADGLKIQQNAFEWVHENNADGIILLLKHKPVITIGKSGGRSNLLVTEEMLNEVGIELHESNRGGNITYHGPGQLVGYPILNLRKFKKDAHWYIRQLEEVIIRTLDGYGISSGRKSEYTGVWVQEKKIAAIGVSLKKWITGHGFALNIEVNKEHFNLINPCGITEFSVASLDDYIEGVDYSDVVKKVILSFQEVFEVELSDVELDILRRE